MSTLIMSIELLGPGDLLRPWDEAANSELLEAVVRWSALARTQLAILDPNLAPRLAVLQTISHLNRVDRRVLALLWHLAERWGRVTPDGVALSLALSHSMIGQLVGARRPTVSTAIAQLVREGHVARGAAGTWVLTGRPVGAPDPRAASSVVPRRSMLALT
jgi:CRP/FNR family transcriptional regulator, cyclic AMP receptor protein